jgi:acyl-CoA reductase-like NAD-dependent aldehyde dehydrogenase
MKEKYGVYINGKWMESTSSQTFTTKNPATGEILATFPSGTKEDTIKAIDAAEKAFPKWKKTPPPKRGDILLKAAFIMKEKKDELGEIVSKEMGKIIAEGKGDVQESIDFLEYISGEGRRLFGETTTSELKDKFCMTIRQPIGVVGCITPWNFPTAIPCWKIGAALVSGNTIVFKPATLTPLCAAKLIEIFEETGLPAGVLNFVTGSGSVVGNELVENPRVKAISFTGGVDAGVDVYSKAAKLLKSVELELGGKNPQIMMDDANIDLAIEGLLFGAFGSQGQRCTATSRLLVHEKIYDVVMKKLVERTQSLTIGNPLDPSVNMGPLSCEQQMNTFLKYVEIGKTEGATLTYGGKQLTDGLYRNGFFVEPTIFEAKHGMIITKEEIFAPVLSVIKIKDYDEAIKVANDIEYGLSSSLYTKNVNLAFKAIDDLESGITYINAPTIGAEVHLPFGGVKHTGNGGREAGTTAIDEFTEMKTVCIDYSNMLQKAQIEE